MVKPIVPMTEVVPDLQLREGIKHTLTYLAPSHLAIKRCGSKTVYASEFELTQDSLEQMVVALQLLYNKVAAAVSGLSTSAYEIHIMYRQLEVTRLPSGSVRGTFAVQALPAGEWI